jgi:hypothetical protein
MLFITLGWFAQAVAAEPALVVVRTYNSFGVPTGQLHTAELITKGLLESVGIRAIWRDCRIVNRAMDAASDPCVDPVAANEVIVRIVTSAAEGTAAYKLGFAYVDPVSASGTLATVFADRVLALAAALETDAGVVLGRAVTHEIGHLLLGTQTHSAFGLMRAVWSHETLLADRADDWRFNAQQASEMRAAADARRPLLK